MERMFTRVCCCDIKITVSMLAILSMIKNGVYAALAAFVVSSLIYISICSFFLFWFWRSFWYLYFYGSFIKLNLTLYLNSGISKNNLHASDQFSFKSMSFNFTLFFWTKGQFQITNTMVINSYLRIHDHIT